MRLVACGLACLMPWLAACGDDEGSTASASSSSQSSSSSGASSASGGSSTSTQGECSGVDLTTDPMNCGVCNKSCEGGACVASACQAANLASLGTYVSSIAVDDTTLYVSTFDVDTGVGEVRSLPKTGGALTTLLPDLERPNQLVLGSGRVFFVQGNTDVWSALTDGTDLLAYDSGMSGPIALAVDAANVYYGRGQEIVQAPHDASSLIPLASAAPLGVVGAAVDGDTVYFGRCQPDGVAKVPVGGGEVTTLGTLTQCPVFLAVAAGALYACDDGGLFRVPSDGSPVVDTGAGCGNVLVALGSRIYSHRQDAIDASTKEEVLVGDAPDSGGFAFAADEGAVYFGTTAGEVMKLVL
ncbi:MAG: hypothetical protein HOV80_31810 [Polyangiaceae bacterium]|nr:hypothetical protein [Polyangiaceae bacterium]